MSEQDPELIYSPHSQFVESEGVKVEVCIYKIEGTDWTLEVVDENYTSTVWDQEFKSDKEAIEEFRRTIREEGVGVMSGTVVGEN